jgi:hypothetical protein
MNPALHLVTSATAQAGERTCERCGESKPAEAFRFPRGWVCDACQTKNGNANVRSWQAENPDRTKEAGRKYRASDHGKAKARARAQVRRDTHPEEALLISARQRAAQAGVPFSITIADIIIPQFCPVLGIELRRSKGKGPSDFSPNLDRFVPSLGYVPGNVSVISNKANRIKNDATIEEIERVISWMRSINRSRSDA